VGGKIEIISYIKLKGRNSMDSVKGRFGEINGCCEGNITSKR